MQRAGLRPVGDSAALIASDSSGKMTGLVSANGKDFIVISPNAPSNSDGRPDGTIYIQTA